MKRKYNFHISQQKSFKRYINYLKKNIKEFIVAFHSENDISSFTLWYDIFQKGNWNMTISDIKRCFKSEFDFKFKIQPKIVKKEKEKVGLSIFFQMNKKYQLEQDLQDEYKEYTFIYCIIK